MNNLLNRREAINSVVVTAEQMLAIEGLIFAAGMPVAALMEKAAGLVATRIQQLYPLGSTSKVGILVGPGHNGGDALVVARELHLAGFEVLVYSPFSKFKELTERHYQYANSLGINFEKEIKLLFDCHLVIDGLFGFGLTRQITGHLAEAINKINQQDIPIISIDIPSGVHTDTGEVLGTAIRATHTLCLGLWKLAFFQDSALEYLGKTELIDIGIPLKHILSIISPSHLLYDDSLPLCENPISPSILTQTIAKQYLPLPRPLTTYKYQQGNLLLICGSSRYSGAAILAGLGGRASGVGMVSIAVPESLKLLLTSQLPEALIIGCPETETGAIAHLPALDLNKFDVIACGPGLTPDAVNLVQSILPASCPLILDADGLNILAVRRPSLQAELGTIASLAQRPAPTILTPHLGEFRRLFPEIESPNKNRIAAVQTAAKNSGAIVLFKGARTAISQPNGSTWLIPESTTALARGGSGDVLTGLMGGLMAQARGKEKMFDWIVAVAAWWHARAGILAARERSELGVDPVTLCQYLADVVVS